MTLKSFLILNSSLENDNIHRKKFLFDVFILINILHLIAFSPKKKKKENYYDIHSGCSKSD